MKPRAAPRCLVVEVMDCAGPRGAVFQVLMLACGAWMTRRIKTRPPKDVGCISCFIIAERARRKRT